MIIYRTTRTCARCGHPVGRDWYADDHNELVAVDCETGRRLERCPVCGNDGRWWEEAEGDNQ